MPEFVQLLLWDPRGGEAAALRLRALRHRARRIILACDLDPAAAPDLELLRPSDPTATAILDALGPGANLVLIDEPAQDALAAAARARGLPCTRLTD